MNDPLSYRKDNCLNCEAVNLCLREEKDIISCSRNKKEHIKLVTEDVGYCAVSKQPFLYYFDWNQRKCKARIFDRGGKWRLKKKK